MNMNGLINMVIRMVMRRGINAGINYAARRGQDPRTMTPAERAKAGEAKALAGKARKGARLAKRMGRF